MREKKKKNYFIVTDFSEKLIFYLQNYLTQQGFEGKLINRRIKINIGWMSIIREKNNFSTHQGLQKSKFEIFKNTLQLQWNNLPIASSGGRSTSSVYKYFKNAR